MSVTPLETPLQIEAVDGMVLINGEHGVVFAMTAEAAITTSDVFQEAALRALGQQKHKDWQLDRSPP